MLEKKNGLTRNICGDILLFINSIAIIIKFYSFLVPDYRYFTKNETIKGFYENDLLDSEFANSAFFLFHIFLGLTEIRQFNIRKSYESVPQTCQFSVLK